jgi:pyruvate dehydrogenase E1 component alpha subunit
MTKGYSIKSYDKSFLKELLRQMLLIRRFEESCSKMYGLKKIGGFLHLYIGTEAVAVGTIANLDTQNDYIFTSYRDHGHAIACGTDPKYLMAELFGKITGCSRGKGGSMHFFDKENNMVGGNGIVGAHIPLAAGAALKIKRKKENAVALAFFGDGAIHQGSFHETLNMARIWNLPAIFICENNGYGMGTAFNRVSSVDDFSLKGTSYDIPSCRIDGMNVLVVYEEMKEVIEQTKKEQVPALVEIKTYRYKGHSVSDPGKYRSKEELESYKKQDPILTLKEEMIEADLLTGEEYNELDKTLKNQVKECVNFAEQSEEPPLKTLYEDVLVD